MHKKTVYTFVALILAVSTALTGCMNKEKTDSEITTENQIEDEKLIASGDNNSSSESTESASGTETAIDGTPIISGNYKLSDCITLCSLEKLHIKYSAKDYASDSAVVIYAKLNKEAHPIVDEPDAEIVWGDKADIDIVSVINGKETDDFTYDHYLALLGGGVLDEKVEKALIGKKAGETFSIECEYDKDYPYEAFSGKMVTYKIKINLIARPDDPTEEELKEARNILSVSAADDRNEAIYTAAKRLLKESSKFTAYPKTMLDNKRRDYEQRYLDVYGSIDNYLEKNGLTKEKYEKEKEIYAVNAVQEDLMFEALKKATGINENSKSYKELVGEETFDIKSDEVLYRLILDKVIKDAVITKE